MKSLSKRPSEGAEWLREIKFDGYRALLWKDGQQVELTEGAVEASQSLG